MSEVETRELRGVAGLELRSAHGSTGLPTIVGYAAVFDEWSVELPRFGGSFRERISPGAFDTVLAVNSPDIRAFTEHDPGNVLGRTPETLRIDVDKRGLRVEIDPPNTSLGRDTVELIRRGDVDGMSFSFTVPEGGSEWSENDSERVVNEVAQLFEVSIVSFPAYQDAVAKVTRSMYGRQHAQTQAIEIERMSAKWKKEST